MPRYAQIDKDGYIISDSYLSDMVDGEDMIYVDDKLDLTNKRWNGIEWEDYEPEQIPEQPLSEQEQIAIDTALTVEYMACLLEANLG